MKNIITYNFTLFCNEKWVSRSQISRMGMTDFALMHHFAFSWHNLSESTTHRPQTHKAREQIFLCFNPGRSVHLMSSNRIHICMCISVTSFSALVLIYQLSFVIHRCYVTLKRCSEEPNMACSRKEAVIWFRLLPHQSLDLNQSSLQTCWSVSNLIC